MKMNLSKLSRHFLMLTVGATMMFAFTGCDKDDPDPGTGNGTGTGNGGTVTDYDYVSWGIRELVNADPPNQRFPVAGEKAVRVNLITPLRGTVSTNILDESLYRWEKSPAKDTIILMEYLIPPTIGSKNTSTWTMTIKLGATNQATSFRVYKGSYVLSKNAADEWVSTITDGEGIIGDESDLKKSTNVFYPGFSGRISWKKP